MKELNSQPEESEGKPAKNFLAKELTRIRAESRQKYGFEPNLKFSNTAYKLYMAKNNVSPGTVKNWKSKISKIELTQLEKEAAELKRKFEQKNQFAAKKAIAAQDWHALQVHFAIKLIILYHVIYEADIFWHISKSEPR